MLKIWLDALTSKQALLMLSLARKLRKKGYKTIITCREYEYTESLLKLFMEKHVCLGKYGGRSPAGKLREDVKRMNKLVKYIKKEKPSVLISYPSPSAIRVAFGLRIPVIIMTDTPHAEKASRLTLPLADYVIYSKCIPQNAIRRFILKKYVKEVTYNGIDELEWINDSFINSLGEEETIKDLGISRKDKIIIFRPEEEKAAYYRFKPIYKRVLESLSRENVVVIFLPRYTSQKQYALKYPNVIVPEKAINIRVLFKQTLAVISGGASLAREASLYGVPSLSYFPKKLHVSECVKKWGFPLHQVRSLTDILGFIRDVIGGKITKNLPKNILGKLQKPSDVVFKVLEETK